MGKTQASGVCSGTQTEALLPFPELMEAIARAAGDMDAGAIQAPARQAVPFPEGATMLSMPATAADIGVHKLVNVVPSNPALGLPTIRGVMSVYDGATGELRALLDGPTVTARRTAAVSMLGLRMLHRDGPRHASVFGTGTQARSHVAALLSLYPDVRVHIVGRTPDKAEPFAARFKDARVSAATAVHLETDLVICATTSPTVIYDEPPRADRLVVGVGAYRHDLAEIGPHTLAGSHLFVDDLAGAREEAGDYLQAGVDWGTVKPLSALLSEGGGAPGPAVFKSVGCAAWDLAAARCALRQLRR